MEQTFEQAKPMNSHQRNNARWQKIVDEKNEAIIDLEGQIFVLLMRLEQQNMTIGEMLAMNKARHDAVQTVPEGFVQVKYTKALGLMIGDKRVEFKDMRLSTSKKSWGFLNSKNEGVVYVDKATQLGLVKASQVDTIIGQFA
jgi:hypothetical protein